ncbi:putative ribonuclease H-like domain-containing protein [Tanacetum coccineum]
MNQFCEMKGILRKFSVARTPQQNRVAERRNRTLIEAARTMLADSKLPNTFWAEAVDIACQARKETELVKDYILLPLWTDDPPYSQYPKSSHDDGSKPSNDDGKKVDEDPRKESKCNDQEKEDNVNSTNNVNVVGEKTSIELPFDLNMTALEDYSIFDFSRDDEDDGITADMNNLDTTIQVSHNPTTRIHKDHPFDQVVRDLQSATLTRKMSKNLEEHGKSKEKCKINDGKYAFLELIGVNNWWTPKVNVVKSSQEERNVGKSNISDSDNTRDGCKIVGGAIRACGGIGERASEAKRYLVKSSKKLEEVFPGEAGKSSGEAGI